MKIIILLTFNFLFVCSSFSQIKNYREIYKYKTPIIYSAGISAHSVLFNHPAKNTINFDNEEDFVSGGSYDGAQVAFDFRVTYNPKELEKYYFSVGIEYANIISKEQYTISSTSVVNYKNENNIITPYLGAYYRFYRIPLANTNLFIGPELRFNFINNSRFVSEIQNVIDRNKTILLDKQLKPDAFRFGSALRIGAEGELHKEFGINVSAALNLFNLTGKDNSYGELLTSGLVKEKTEISFFTLIYNISIFYRL